MDLFGSELGSLCESRNARQASYSLGLLLNMLPTFNLTFESS